MRENNRENITYPYFAGFSLSQVIDMNTLTMEYQQAREIFCDLSAVCLNSQLKNHKFSCLEQHPPSKGQVFFRCPFAFSSCDSVPNTSSLQSSVDCWIYHEREIDYDIPQSHIDDLFPDECWDVVFDEFHRRAKLRCRQLLALCDLISKVVASDKTLLSSLQE